MLKPSDLHVVSVFSNNRRWRSRERLLRRFIPHMQASGVTLTMVEHVMGERDFVLDPDDPALAGVRLFQVRGDSRQENWLKEGLIRYGVSRLPADAKYLAVIDADVFFQRQDWALATLDMLQVHRVGQPWSYSVDLGPDENPVCDEHGRQMDRSFCAAWAAGDIIVTDEDYGIGQSSAQWLLDPERKRDWRQHYGYAWAFRLDVWNDFGGLPDWLVTGAADYIAAMAFAGKLDTSDAYTSPACARRLRHFAAACDRAVRQDIGVVPGLLSHGFHGSKKKRFYLDRKDILREANFDPDVDIGYDRHGLPFLASDNRILRDGLRRLSVARDEDSNAL
ncbi:hypothetical protein NO263_03875 [Gluconacetobacter entanii]|uniref:Glycosyl transferase n=1 Tax=Gluconacetobacter entanii TaxID=108528 RepID=A0ABT3K2S5_9PROT|nr:MULTISPECIES: hypothetical protein [Acetobacteraceae]MCW4589715.1 hypothetical protein [Gluconacetobacter entanii]MCW4593418.1 hypothetical protein [Gluconacetobacter entanii]NPC89221.1 hypothetical protein [Gluconacetobacter entanii]